MTILKANLMSSRDSKEEKSPWITYTMTYYVACLPNYLAKIKKNRNDADNLMRAGKRKYFTENLDA